MRVTKIHNCYHVSKDLTRQSAFYRDALGLELRFEDGDQWVQLKAGDSNFALASPKEGAVAAGAVVVFEVDDLEAAKAAILTAGGKVAGVRDMGSHGSTLAASDTEGIAFQLFTREPSVRPDAPLKKKQ